MQAICYGRIFPLPPHVPHIQWSSKRRDYRTGGSIFALTQVQLHRPAARRRNTHRHRQALSTNSVNQQLCRDARDLHHSECATCFPAECLGVGSHLAYDTQEKEISLQCLLCKVPLRKCMLHPSWRQVPSVYSL